MVTHSVGPCSMPMHDASTLGTEDYHAGLIADGKFSLKDSSSEAAEAVLASDCVFNSIRQYFQMRPLLLLQKAMLLITFWAMHAPASCRHRVRS